VAPFLQGVTALGRGLQLTLGARYDYFQLRFDAPSDSADTDRSMQLFCPKVALNWRHGDSNIYASVSRGIQDPHSGTNVRAMAAVRSRPREPWSRTAAG